MRIRTFLTVMLLVFAAEAALLIIFAVGHHDLMQDAVAVNEVVQSVQNDWDRIETHQNRTELDYILLDKNGTVVFRTKAGLSENINEAVIHRDTILDIEVGGVAVGKIMIDNSSVQLLQKEKQRTAAFLIAAVLVQCAVCTGFILSVNRTVIKPFKKLKDFAWRVAGGNLEIPLEMDRENLFGAFTESFDVMRSELKKARMAEAKANESKKELVAKLSHDIKTPVASIKAVSEVGAALTDDEKVKENYAKIIHKADQINTLVSNLFTATLEELKQLTVTPADLESSELSAMLENADYLHRAVIPAIPGCLISADRLRLQQVFDNIFSNSYKYADTEIFILTELKGNYLVVSIEDLGGGVGGEELPLLKEKFKRGSNADKVEGAGLGLYISDYFMEKMHGELVLENGERGLRATVIIPLSGAA